MHAPVGRAWWRGHCSTWTVLARGACSHRRLMGLAALASSQSPRARRARAAAVLELNKPGSTCAPACTYIGAMYAAPVPRLPPTSEGERPRRRSRGISPPPRARRAAAMSACCAPSGDRALRVVDRAPFCSSRAADRRRGRARAGVDRTWAGRICASTWSGRGRRAGRTGRGRPRRASIFILCVAHIIRVNLRKSPVW